jgi:thermitase
MGEGKLSCIALCVLLMFGTLGVDVEARGSHEPDSAWSPPVAGRFVEGEIIVTLKTVPEDRNVVDSILRGHGGLIKRWMLNPRNVLVQVNPRGEKRFVKSIENDPLIEETSLNYIHELALKPAFINDDFWNRPNIDDYFQYAPKYINANYAWREETGALDIRICDFDTGIKGNHIELIANYDVGWDFVDGDGDPTPNPGINMGHGTHMMGVMAARTNNFDGLAGIADVTVVDVRVSDSGSGPLASTIRDALTWVVNEDACDIVVMPFTSMTDPGYHNEIINVYSDGKLLVASAGNDWDDQVHYPAKYDEVIAVSAVRNPAVPRGNPQGPGRWGRSNYGPEIELSAPGDDIVTTYYHTLPEDQQPDYCGSDPPYDYAFCDGTSLAAAHVAALAGLVWSTCPTLSRDQLRELLQTTADDWGDPGRDEHFGYGFINALDAVKAAQTRFEQSKAYVNNERCDVLLHIPGVGKICDHPAIGNTLTIYSETASVLRYALWRGSGSMVEDIIIGGSVDISYPHYEDFIVSIMTDEAKAPVGWIFCRENGQLSCRGLKKERDHSPYLYANMFDSNADIVFLDADKVTVSDTGDPAKAQILDISTQAHEILYSLWFSGSYTEGLIPAFSSDDLGFPDSTPFMLSLMTNYHHSPDNWPRWGWIVWLLCYETSHDLGCVPLEGERYVYLGWSPSTEIMNIPGFGGFREDASYENVEAFSDFYGIEHSIWWGSGLYNTAYLAPYSTQTIYPPKEAFVLSTSRHDAGMGWAFCKADSTYPYFSDATCAILSPEEVPNGKGKDIANQGTWHRNNPEIAVDHSDNVHVVWEEHRGNWEIYYKKLDSMGNTLILTTNLITFPQDPFTDDQFGPVIAMGPDPADPTNPNIEIIYVFWAGEESNIDATVYEVQGKWAFVGSENTWFDIDVNQFIFLSDMRGLVDRSNKIDAVVDTSGNIHLIYTQYMYLSIYPPHPDEECQWLVHKASSDKGVTWSSSLDIIDTGWGPPLLFDHLDWIRYPHMALSTIRANDRLFVVFSYDENPIEVGTWDGHETSVKFLIVWYLGPEWTTSTIYDRGLTQNEAVYNDIVVNNGEAESYVVWHTLAGAGYEVRYSRNWRIIREGWNGAEFLTYFCEIGCWDDGIDLVFSFENAEYPTIAVEPNNGLHVVWSDNGKEDTNYEIMHIMSENGWDWDNNYCGLGWQISDDSGLSTNPAVAVGSQGTVHMVWLDHAGWKYIIRYNQWQNTAFSL